MRRHHLIEEAKSELDVAYDEVKRAESKIMALEQDYNDQVKTLNGAGMPDDIRRLMSEKESIQSGFNLESLYGLQGMAVERFAMVSSAFTIVASVEEVSVSVDLIRNILFRADEIRGRKIDIDTALREFSAGLRAYSREESSRKNDLRVRQSWDAIEALLRGFGRNI